MGVARRGVPSEPPPAKGEFASRPMVARLVRYGPVRQKKTFLELSQSATPACRTMDGALEGRHGNLLAARRALEQRHRLEV